MLAIDDYLPCASPSTWLPGWLEGRAAATCGPTPVEKGPRALRRILGALGRVGDVSIAAGSLDALVHLGPVDRPLDAALARARLDALALGGAVLDVAFAATAARLEAWGRLGVARLEQWVCDDARGLVLTLGTRLADVP